MSESTDLVPLPKFSGNDLFPTDALVPATGATDELVGRENLDRGDISIPTLALLQSMSPAISDGVEGAKPGKFMIASSEEVIEGPIRAVAVFHNKSRYMSEAEANKRKAKPCRSSDALEGSEYGPCDQCEFGKWGPNNEPPSCALAHNVTLVLAGRGPVRLRFTKTGFKNGKNFINTFLLSRKNLWHHPVILTSIQREAKINGATVKFYVPKLTWDQSVTVPEQLRAGALELYKELSAAFEDGRLQDDAEGVDV